MSAKLQHKCGLNVVCRRSHSVTRKPKVTQERHDFQNIYQRGVCIGCYVVMTVTLCAKIHVCKNQIQM